MRLPSKRKIRRIRRRNVLYAYKRLKYIIKSNSLDGRNSVWLNTERGYINGRDFYVAARLLCFKHKKFKIQDGAENLFIPMIVWES